MPQEFEGDLTGAVFWGADLSGARFRDVDLNGRPDQPRMARRRGCRRGEALENGTNPLQERLYTVFEEAFWHNRYARRDLARLEATR